MARARRTDWEKAGDRRTGISAKQGATAATRNVLDGRLSDDEIVALVVDQVIAFQMGKRSTLPEPLESIAKGTRYNKIARSIRRGAASATVDIDHLSHVTEMAHPITREREESLVAATLLERDLLGHAEALDTLRALSRRHGDDTYGLLIGGRCGQVIDGAGADKFPGHDPALLIDVARTHARLLVIRHAHDRIASIRRLSVEPHGKHFAGFNTWLTVGHSCMAMIAAPALLLQRLPRIAGVSRYAKLGGDDLLSALVCENILPPLEGRRIIALAEAATDMLNGRGISHIPTGLLLRAIAKTCKAASQLNRGAMKEAGWSKIDFTEYSVGLSAAEAASFVALEALRAFQQIDEIIALIRNAELTARRRARPPMSKRPLAYASVILRAEGLPDRAAKTHDPSMNLSHAEEQRGSGRSSVVSMLAKLADPSIEHRARQLLGIDVNQWFER